MYGRIPWFLWPAAAFLELLSNLAKTLLNFFSALLGLLFIVTGILISLTFIGCIIGIPLVSFGLYLMFRSHF